MINFSLETLNNAILFCIYHKNTQIIKLTLLYYLKCSKSMEKENFVKTYIRKSSKQMSARTFFLLKSIGFEKFPVVLLFPWLF